MRALASLFLAVSIPIGMGAEPVAEPSPKPVPEARPEAAKVPVARTSPALEAALARLKLPGVKIDPAGWCVDVDATVCLREGLLELIACTKDTKEHESLVVVEAKPSHIHTALLLLHAKPGNPAMQRPLDPEGTRFMPVPPRGGDVAVFLVIKAGDGKVTERPISDFITRTGEAEPAAAADETAEAVESGKFPTHTFLFAGSILHGEGAGPRHYLCDQSGNVISIATFGDEVLCLPEIHESDNGALEWGAKTDSLPALGTKVILRLRPQDPPPAVPDATAKPPAK